MDSLLYGAIMMVAIVLVLYVFSVWHRAPTARPASAKSVSHDDYAIWVNVIKESTTRFEEFDLFGTRAAVLWNDGEPEVTVVCITEFRNQIPATKKYDHYEFNVKEWYWAGLTPRGSAGRIRSELERIFKTKAERS